MENIRSGNMKVCNMKSEINIALFQIRIGYLHKRAQRQLVDGMKFLEMIEEEPYKSCKTVSQLKTKISEEREKLKARIATIDQAMPGHQFTFFEMIEDVSKEEQTMKTQEKARLLNEVKWLHKCLGIASNRNYFK